MDVLRARKEIRMWLNGLHMCFYCEALASEILDLKCNEEDAGGGENEKLHLV